jgi:hypothetical protein
MTLLAIGAVCPLFEARKRQRAFELRWQDETPPTITTTRYRMQVTHPLRYNSSLSDEEQCPPGTWICKTGTPCSHPDADV